MASDDLLKLAEDVGRTTADLRDALMMRREDAERNLLRFEELKAELRELHRALADLPPRGWQDGP